MSKLAFSTAIAAAFVSTAAMAGTSTYDLTGSGITGTLTLTYTPDPNTGPLGTSPNTNNPIGSYDVTGITGTFSDSNIGLANALITGIIGPNPASPQPTNLLAPANFGFYPVGSGLPTPEGTAPGLSYDDLYYPDGSPQTATSYPFHGGVLDIYGLIFALANGDAVNLWSNGDMGQGVSYGAAVTDGTSLLDRQGGLSMRAVPEPASWSLLLLGFGAIGLAMRRQQRRERRPQAA